MQATKPRQGSFTVSAKVLPILQICRTTKLVWDVVSWNLQRRHLSESQRAAVAAKLANMQSGRRTDIQPRANLHEVSIPEAASLLNVSERSVKSAKKVEQEGIAELNGQLLEGKISVNAGWRQERGKL